MDKILWATLTPEQRDRLVAEKVMNNLPGPCTGVWRQSTPDSGEWDFLCPRCGAAIAEEDYEKRDALHDALPVPRYTQSMDAVKLLRQHMAQTYPSNGGKEPQYPARRDYEKGQCDSAVCK